jgi:hypothetical protein
MDRIQRPALREVFEALAQRWVCDEAVHRAEELAAQGTRAAGCA